MGIFSKKKFNFFLGLVLLLSNYFDFEKLSSDIQSKYKIKISNFNKNENSCWFKADEYEVIIVKMENQISEEEIKSAAEANNFDEKALDIAERYTNHLVVRVSGNKKDNLLNRHLMLLKIIICMFSQQTPIGLYSWPVLYTEGQIKIFELMLEKEEIPIEALIYIGIIEEENNLLSGYTSGLHKFDKKEIEIVQSKQPLMDIYGCLYDVASYVIKNNITLKPGETIGYGQEDKNPISLSKGYFVEEKSFKIHF